MLIADEPGDREAVRVTSWGCINQSAACSDTANAGGDATAQVSVTLKLRPILRAAPAAALTTGGWAQVCASFNITNTSEDANGYLVNSGGQTQIGNGTYLSGPLPPGAPNCGGGGGQTLTTTPGTPLAHSIVANDTSLSSISGDSNTMFAAFFGTTLDQFRNSPSTCTITGNSAGQRADNLIAAYNGTTRRCRDFWVDGDIQFSGNATLGSATDPIVMVSTSNMRFNGNYEIYGIIYSDSADWNNLGTGTSDVHGADHLARGLPQQRQWHDRLRPGHPRADPRSRPTRARPRHLARLPMIAAMRPEPKAIDMKTKRFSRNGGFTLIEALIALLVMAFGMLAIAGFQINLSRNSDVAKQRAEATRLGQEQIEQLRSFATFAGYGALTSGNDNVSTNATFARSWTFSGTAADPQRTLTVNVGWTDRANEAQTISLFTVIAEADATEAGGLAVPAIENGILRRPLARNINIPVPAVQLGGTNIGKSKMQWGGSSGGWLVFSDASGDVIRKCASEPGDETNLDDPSLCETLVAYLLTGFINDGSFNNSWPWTLTGATLTNTLNVIGFECFLSDATDPNNGSPIAGFKFYSCLIQPTDHDGDEDDDPPPTTPTPRVWTGKLEFVPAPTGTQKVCRYLANSTDSSGVHQNVTQTLDNQNYYVRGSGNCDAGAQAQHQP